MSCTHQAQRRVVFDDLANLVLELGHAFALEGCILMYSLPP